MKEKIFVLFFDAKMETVVQRKEYQSFLKEIKKIGYIILQKSVYIKHVCDDQRLKEETKKMLYDEKKSLLEVIDLLENKKERC